MFAYFYLKIGISLLHFEKLTLVIFLCQLSNVISKLKAQYCSLDTTSDGFYFLG